MPDIVLYAGEATQNDIRLRDTTGQSVAITGQSSDVRCGTIRADWHITGQQGDLSSQVTNAIALVGLASSMATGTLTQDGSAGVTGLFSTAQAGDMGGANTSTIVGAASDCAAGDLDNASDSALLGALIASESGTVSTNSGDLSLALTGQASSGSTGTLTTSGGDFADDLLELQRQRRFGQQYRTLVRTPYRRTVR